MYNTILVLYMLCANIVYVRVYVVREYCVCVAHCEQHIMVQIVHTGQETTQAVHSGALAGCHVKHMMNLHAYLFLLLFGGKNDLSDAG